MRNKVVLTALLALSVSACNVVDGKREVSENRTPPRAYVAAPNTNQAAGENKWVKLEMAPAQQVATANASPADLAGIEPAAGGAAAFAPRRMVTSGEVVNAGTPDHIKY